MLGGLVVAAASGLETDGNGAAAGEARTIEVRMTDELRFDPDVITVAPGETIRFVVTNAGDTAHEFLIGDEAEQAEFEEEMAVGGMDHETSSGVSVDPEQTDEFEYTFDDTEGEILAGCHEPGHYDGGMVATITVGD